MTGTPQRWSGLLDRARWLVVLLFAVVLGGLTAAGLPGFGRDGLTLRELAPVNAPEIRTEITAAEQFKVPLNARTQVVHRDPDGIPLPVQRAEARLAFQRTRAIQEAAPEDRGPIALYAPITNAYRVFPASAEEGTTTITNLIAWPDSWLRDREAAARELAAEVGSAGATGRVSVTGGVPAQLATGRIIRANLDRLQWFSIAALVIVIALWHRSVVVPLVVALTVASTMLTMLHTLGALSSWVAVPSEVLPVVLSVAIGVATDFVLFYVGALKRQLATGLPAPEAGQNAIGEAAPIVLTAGLTTIFGSASLLMATTGFIRAFAPGMVIAVCSASLSALLLTPALIAIWVRLTGSPLRTRPGTDPGALARRLVGHRGLSRGLAMAGVVLIAGLATQAGSSPLGFNIINGLPDDHEVSVGAEDAAAGFAPGILSPTLLLIEGEDLDLRVRELMALSRGLEEVPGVAGVLGSDAFDRVLRRTGLDEDLPQELQKGPQGLLITDDGRYARLAIVLDHEAFTGVATQDLNRLSAALPGVLADSGLADATPHLAGDTALVARVTTGLNGDLLRVGVTLLIIELALLLIALRSLAAALFIVGASITVTLAALGTVSLADRWFGDGLGVVFFVPIAAFVLLVSIGADYGVLMGTALREARRAVDDPSDRNGAVAAGAIAAVGPTIIQAGLVLVVTFSLLSVVPLGAFAQFAVVMGAGVALDAFVVRPLLMPLLLSGALHAPGTPRNPIRYA